MENANYSDIVTGNYNAQYNNKSYWETVHSFWYKYNVAIIFMPDNSYTGYFEYYLKNYIK
mgnify:FL=1